MKMTVLGMRRRLAKLERQFNGSPRIHGQKLAALIRRHLQPVRLPGAWYVCFMTSDDQAIVFSHYYEAERAERMAQMFRETAPGVEVVVLKPGDVVGAAG